MENSKITYEKEGKLILENAKIIFRNFTGVGNDYNHDGDRNFCVIIDDQDAINDLLADGWNIKTRPAREEGDLPLNYVKVNVSYKYKGPKIFRHIGDATIEVVEDTVQELDKDDILYCDMVIVPYKWSRKGNEGISAYLQELHAVIRPDYFGAKYGNI